MTFAEWIDSEADRIVGMGLPALPMQGRVLLTMVAGDTVYEYAGAERG